VDPAEVERGLAARLLRIDAAAPQPLRLHVDVKPHLVGHGGVEVGGLAKTKRRLESRDEAAHDGQIS
jgi:hypothetical protein